MKLYLNLGKALYFKHNFLKHSGLRVSLTRYLATVGVQIHCSLSLHGRGSFTVLRLWEYKRSARCDINDTNKRQLAIMILNLYLCVEY